MYAELAVKIKKQLELDYFLSVCYAYIVKMKSIVRHVSLLSASILLSVVLTSSVFAIGKPQNENNHPNISVIQNGQNGQNRSCQARENAIKTRMSHLTLLATNMETKFDSIATRVENFYTNKVVPSGKTVPNYNTLVSNIQTQKTNVQTALTKAQNDANSFSCTSGTPQAQMTQFREDMQAVKSALKEYRTAIKNLIVAVHSVTGTENSEGSPKPTK